MSPNQAAIDVLYSPWCFIEAPDEVYKREFEERWGAMIREFNIWEIEDRDLAALPAHVAAVIRKLRDPDDDKIGWHAGGTLFFLNGALLELSPALKWPQVERRLEQLREEG